MGKNKPQGSETHRQGAAIKTRLLNSLVAFFVDTIHKGSPKWAREAGSNRGSLRFTQWKLLSWS